MSEFKKEVETEWFGENVSELVVSTDSMNGDVATFDCISEVMVFEIHMSGSGAHFGHLCHGKSSRVIFKHFTMNLWC